MVANNAADTLMGRRSRGNALQEHHSDDGLAMLFAAGDRPALAEIRDMLDAPELAGFGASLSFYPEPEEGWAEVLVNGLTFDLAGLAPFKPGSYPEPSTHFGTKQETGALEAITIVPGDHIRTSMPVMPLVRAMTALIANLSLPLEAKGVLWAPARTLMEPGYFARVIMNWQSGGVFPALGLTAIDHCEDGSAVTSGLSYFIGQEALIQSGPGEDRAATAKLAIRVVDYLVANGPVERLRALSGIADEPLTAVPAEDGQLVRIVRAAD